MYEFPPSTPPPENLTKDVIQHLSKEIETTNNNMMAFRTRIGFGMFVGPFVLLGSFIVAAKGQPVSFTLTSRGKVALVVDVVCFLGIAYIASQIEAQSLKQCDRWRTLIADLSRTPPPEMDRAKLTVHLNWHGLNGPFMGYVVGYFLLFVAVIAAVVIVNSGTVAPESQSGSGATFRIEQVTPTPQQK